MLNAVLLFMGIFLYPVKIYPRINSCVYQRVRIFSCQSPIEVRALSNAYNYDYDSGGRFSLYLIGPFAETHFCCDNKYDDISNSLVCL